MGSALSSCCEIKPQRNQPPNKVLQKIGPTQPADTSPNTAENKQQNKKKVSKNDFVLLGELGRGGYGKVSLVQNKETKKKFALKEIKKSLFGATPNSKMSVSELFNEKNVMKDSQSHFVVKLYSAFQDNYNVYFLMEYMEGGNLFSYLRQRKCFSEEVAKFYSAEVLLGLEYLHTKLNIIYRDLKPENILLGSDGHIKLSDFGLSKINLQYVGSIKGTPDFIAPEVFLNEPCDQRIDYWSLGCLLFEMLFGQPAFSNESMEQRIKRIISGQYKFPVNDRVSEQAKNLIRNLLQVDPSKRLGNKSIDEIKQHEFYKSINWSDLMNKKISAPITNIEPKISKQKQKVEYEEPTEYNVPGFTYVASQRTFKESIQ